MPVLRSFSPMSDKSRPLLAFPISVTPLLYRRFSHAHESNPKLYLMDGNVDLPFVKRHPILHQIARPIILTADETVNPLYAQNLGNGDLFVLEANVHWIFSIFLFYEMILEEWGT